MKNLAKVVSYLGFAARARKIVFGADNVVKTRSRRLIIMCPTAGENTRKAVTAYAEKSRSPLVLLDSGMTIDEILKKNNCKVIAVTDENLAKAIIDNA